MIRRYLRSKVSSKNQEMQQNGPNVKGKRLYKERPVSKSHRRRVSVFANKLFSLSYKYTAIKYTGSNRMHFLCNLNPFRPKANLQICIKCNVTPRYFVKCENSQAYSFLMLLNSGQYSTASQYSPLRKTIVTRKEIVWIHGPFS